MYAVRVQCACTAGTGPGSTEAAKRQAALAHLKVQQAKHPSAGLLITLAPPTQTGSKLASPAPMDKLIEQGRTAQAGSGALVCMSSRAALERFGLRLTALPKCLSQFSPCQRRPCSLRQTQRGLSTDFAYSPWMRSVTF